MEARVIIISAQKSNKSENTVWAVAVTGDHYPKAYCKSAYKGQCVSLTCSRSAQG